MTPKVSIIMSVYNGQSYVQEALDSLLGQTLDDFELILVDDGSTDATPDIVGSISDRRLLCHRRERNQGLTASLNFGLSVCRGDYIARQDADDLSAPHRLERQAAFLDAHPEVALLGSWYREIDAHGCLRRLHRLPTAWTDLRWSLLFHCPFVHGAVMLRRSCLEQVGGYDESLSYSQDYELWSRLASRFPAANLPEYLMSWRSWEGSMTATFGPRTEEGLQLRIAGAARRLNWDGSPTGRRQRFLDMYSLLFPVDSARPPGRPRAAPAIEDVFELQQRFAQECGLSRAEEQGHRRRVTGRLARGLLRHSREAGREGRYREASQLAARAFFLDPRSVSRRIAGRR